MRLSIVARSTPTCTRERRVYWHECEYASPVPRVPPVMTPIPALDFLPPHGRQYSMVARNVKPPEKCSPWNKEARMELGSWIRPSPHFIIVCAMVITDATNFTSAHANVALPQLRNLPKHEHHTLGHPHKQLEVFLLQGRVCNTISSYGISLSVIDFRMSRYARHNRKRWAYNEDSSPVPEVILAPFTVPR